MAPNATFLESFPTEVTHMLKDKWDFNPTCPHPMPSRLPETNEWLVWGYKSQTTCLKVGKHCGINLLWLLSGIRLRSDFVSTYLLSKWAIQFYIIYELLWTNEEKREIRKWLYYFLASSFEILPLALTSFNIFLSFTQLPTQIHLFKKEFLYCIFLCGLFNPY